MSTVLLLVISNTFMTFAWYGHLKYRSAPIVAAILAHGFARAICDACQHDFLIAFSCKGRGVCPSCNTRRMVETAAHLTEHVMPRLPARQWVLSVPKRLRLRVRNPEERTFSLSPASFLGRRV